MTPIAAKRLKAIEEYSHLGAGFKIAMRDLEIRGAGSILGTAQSGHIVAVGFDLYCQLLKQAVAQLKGDWRLTQAVAGTTQLDAVHHAVADEPVRAGGFELRVGAVAIERAVELARQFAGHFQERRIAFHRDRRQIGPLDMGTGFLLHGVSSFAAYLYIVKMK